MYPVTVVSAEEKTLVVWLYRGHIYVECRGFMDMFDNTMGTFSSTCSSYTPLQYVSKVDSFITLFTGKIPFLYARGAEILQKSTSHLQLVHTGRVTQSRFNTENSQILGVIIHNLVIMATWCLGFANLYSMQLRKIVSNFRCCNLLCGQFFLRCCNVQA